MSFDYHETLENTAVNFTASGDNTVIAAPGDGKYLAIDFLQFVPAGDVTITYWNGPSATGTAISGAMPFKANQAITSENAMKNEHGVITCGNNQPFVINLGSAVACTGFCRYRIINK